MDCLRLVSMLMVVSMHYFGWGGVNSSPDTSKNNFILASVISVFCHVSVNCFYMLTEYFIKPFDREIKGKETLVSVLKQYKKVWFYSVLLYVVFCLTGIVGFSFSGALRYALPIMFNQYWFMTVFVLLLCLKPFVAKVVCNLKDKELIVLLCALLFFDCVQAIFGSNAFGEKGAGFLHGLTMVLVGYGIKRLPAFRYKRAGALLLYVGSCLVAGVLALVAKKYFHAEDAVSVYYNSPLMVAGAAGLVTFFSGLSFNWKWVSKIAPYTLAIYLINDHPLVREHVWEKVLHCSRYYESNLMIGHFILSVVLFAVVGVLVDWGFSSIEKRLVIRN